MKSEELTDDAIDYIIENMELVHLNQWEQSFYESICDQWQRRRSLSEAQKLKLGSIWDRQP